jgi:hypothetical protein
VNEEEMSEISGDQILNWFSYHPPASGDVADLHQAVRDQCHDLAKFIVLNTPPSQEQKVAIMKLREVMMWSNSAIACNS